MRWLALLLLSAIAPGCGAVGKMAAPSNARNWSPDQAVLAYAVFRGNKVDVHNVRNCQYFTVEEEDDPEEEYVVHHEKRTYDLNDISAVDFFMVPFEGMPRLAHTMLSFEFRPPDKPPEYLTVSIEIRKERDEVYGALKGFARQYEIMYVVADERDVVGVRANHRGENVYLYRTTATPEQSRKLFVDVLARVNGLASRPEFYDTLTNNCTTNLVRHVNRIHPRRIKYDYQVLLPGYSDELAYKEGLIVRDGSWDETKEQAYINPRVWSLAEHEDFSAAIRRR